MGKIVLTSYISHGAPTSLVERTKIHDVYESTGKVLKDEGVDTVVVSSPHYFSSSGQSGHDGFEIESRENIPCIQDYYGFPEELYKFSYHAKNDLILISEIVKESRNRNVNVVEAASWGLDHGAWLPLYFMFPKQDIKVVPVSITSAGPEEHFRLGEAIKAAVRKTEGNVAVFGTGSPVHRLDLVRYGYYGEDKFEPGVRFDEKLIETLSTGDFDKILKVQQEYPSLFHSAAPEGKLSPLFVALGASEKNEFVGKTILHEFMYYGVSLIATVLSADDGIKKSLLALEADRMTVS